MKRILFLLITVFCGLNLSAQHKLDWVNFPYMEKGYQQWVDDIKVDNAGNIYTRQNKIGVFTGSSAPCYQKIVKQDPFGNVLWETLISTAVLGEESLEPLLVQQNGFLYTPVCDDITFSVLRINEVSGNIDTIMSQPIPLNYQQNIYYGIVQGYNGMLYSYWQAFNNSNPHHICIYETDTGGTLLHTCNYTPPYPYAQFNNYESIFTDNQGNLYTQYDYTDSQNQSYIRYLKFYSDGTLAYDTAFGRVNCNGKLFAVDSAGSSYWINDSVVNKLDTSLNVLWTYVIPQPDDADGLNNIVDKDGNVYFFVYWTYASNRIYLIKLRSDGSLIYRYHIPDEGAGNSIDVHLASNGDVLLPAISNVYTDDNAYLCHKEVMELTRLDSVGTVKELLYDTIFYTQANPVEIARDFVLPNGDVFMAADFSNLASLNYANNDTTLYSIYAGMWYTVKLCQVCGTDNVIGKVGVDTGGVCQADSASPPGANSIVFLSPGTRASVVDNTGAYQFSQVPPGNYSVSVSPPPYLFSDCDSVYSFAVDSLTPQNSYNFSLAPMTGCNMNLEISGSRGRAGYLQHTNVVYFNEMWQPVTGMLAVTLDSLFIFYRASPVPDSVSGNTYFWKFNNLQPYYQKDVNIYSVVTVIDTYNTNYFHLYAALYTDCNNLDSILTADTLTDYIYTSFDPNEKDVFPLTNRKYNQFIDKNAPLSFQINFQNTGNDTAFRVVVRDTIDPGFNIKTIQFTGSGSPCQMTVGPNRDVAFTFINMELPPADSNADMSHGYVRYSIVPSDTMQLGQYVSNSASIYFDFNNPVVTNTVTLQYVSKYPNAVINVPDATNSITLFPNPTTDQLFIKTENITPETIIIYDVNGRIILTQPFKPEIDVTQLSSGVYFIEVQSRGEVARKRFVKM
jgi:uncharacterized repeat protein (TIGR01451 family)